MRHGIILVEGQTEDRIVKRLLRPYLAPRLWLIPTIIETNAHGAEPRVKGGVSSYARLRAQLDDLLNDRSTTVVTTLFDYYGLPMDVPGMATRPLGSALARVEHVERELKRATDDERFVPFLALHEVEAWLFSDLDRVANALPAASDLDALRRIRAAVATPEAINENYATAPSRRVLAACPGYRKPWHGPLALEAIGVERIRAQCPHFDAWLRALEAA